MVTLHDVIKKIYDNIAIGDEAELRRVLREFVKVRTADIWVVHRHPLVVSTGFFCTNVKSNLCILLNEITKIILDANAEHVIVKISKNPFNIENLRKNRLYTINGIDVYLLSGEKLVITTTITQSNKTYYVVIEVYGV